MLSVVAVAMAGVAVRRHRATRPRRPSRAPRSTPAAPAPPRRRPPTAPAPHRPSRRRSRSRARSSAARSTSRSSTTPASPASPAGVGRAGHGRRLAGRRLRQLVRHHPGQHGLLPGPAQGRPAAARPRPRHPPARRRRSPRCGSTGSPSSSPAARYRADRGRRTRRDPGRSAVTGWVAMEFTSADARAAVRRAGRPSRADVVVGLDFDGTLVADRRRPRARPHIHPDAPGVLLDLAGGVRAVAVITGRPARQALALGGLDEVGDAIGDARRASCFVFGQYGNERWSSTNRRVVSPRPPQGLAALPARAAPACCATPDAADAFVEDKGLAVAVHTRRLDDPAGAFERLLSRCCAELAERHGLVVEPGRNVIEVALAGHAQGRRRARPAPRSSRPAAFLFAGDDLGDVEAFEAVAELRERGPARRCWSARPPTRRARWSSCSDVVVHGPDGRARPAAPLLDRRTPARCGSGRRRTSDVRRIQHRGLRRAHRETACLGWASAHREGLRERPVDVPATTASLPSTYAIGRGAGAKSVPGESRPGKMRRRHSMSTAGHRDPSRTHGLREGAFGNARALSCRECGHEVALGPALRVSGVLRAARGRLRLPGGHPRARSRPARATSGATRRCCRCPTDIEREPQHRARLHPAAARPTTSAASSASTSSGSRTTRPTRPTPSRTASSPAR